MAGDGRLEPRALPPGSQKFSIPITPECRSNQFSLDEPVDGDTDLMLRELDDWRPSPEQDYAQSEFRVPFVLRDIGGCKLACENLHHIIGPVPELNLRPLYRTTTVKVVLCVAVPDVAVSVKL